MLEVDQPELNEISDLLHVIFHRNKNQHRLAKWWKWFAMLKRSINRLRTEIDGREFLRADTRIKYMRDILLHRCHRAFSNVVADPQFSPIGLVLIAILARINQIICAQRVDTESHTTDMALELRADEDLGEAVTRDVLGNVNKGMDTVSGDAISKRMGVAACGEKVSPPKPKRKKLKAANAIDDLFSAIL